MNMDEIGNETLQRYVTSREKIDRDIDFIMAFTSLLSQYKDCSGDEVLVDLYSIGYVNQMLHSKVLDIMEELDGFLPLWDAQQATVEEAGGED